MCATSDSLNVPSHSDHPLPGLGCTHCQGPEVSGCRRLKIYTHMYTHTHTHARTHARTHTHTHTPVNDVEHSIFLGIHKVQDWQCTTAADKNHTLHLQSNPHHPQTTRTTLFTYRATPTTHSPPVHIPTKPNDCPQTHVQHTPLRCRATGLTQLNAVT